MEPDQRRRWLFPPAHGHLGDIDRGHLDPAEEDGRRLLIEADHPELADALDDDLDEIVVDGRSMSPRLHVLMHEAVASQLWDDDPAEVWATAGRLAAAGYDRHDVLHMLASVLAHELWHTGRHRGAFDRDRYIAALAALPESWDEDWDGEEGEEDRFPFLPPADGTTFTHRLTAAEVAGSFVTHAPDLEPLDPLLLDHGHLHLAGGEVAEAELDDDGYQVLVGPEGWLSPGLPHELVGFRVAGDEVEVVAVTAPAAPEELGDRLLSAFEQANDGDGMPVTVADLVNEAIADLDAAEPPVLPPIGDLLTGCGFEVRDGYAAPEGTDWEAFGRVRAMAAVAAAHGLDPDEAHVVVNLSELYRLFVEGELLLDEAEDGVFREVADMLAGPHLAVAFLDAALLRSDVEDLQRFLDTVGRRAGRRHRAGVAWIGSAAARRAGDHERAESLLGQALEADPWHEAALRDAAWYASDRGDARRAVKLLGRLEQVGDEEAAARAAVLRRYADPPTRLARRNDPCPCGSGRKHKHCCLGAARAAPLPDRVRWIWEKLTWFLCEAGAEDDVEDVLGTLGTAAASDEPLAASLVLFDDGVVDEFLLVRGPLLPDDERNLVAQWAMTERSVQEVVAVDPGAGVTVRDVRTGDVLDVRERRGSTELAVGDLLCAHVVPDGATHQIVGGIIPVPLQLRDHLVTALDAGSGAVELAELVRAAWSPPEMFTMEGEPVVACAARYELADPAGVEGLDAVLDRGDDGRWSESVEVDGRTWVRGTVAVEGGELVVSANSETRFARLRETVEAAVPDLSLRAETAVPAAEMLAQGERSFPPPVPDVPPEAAAALAAFVREQEERWVDEPVPALGGLTPRQAADDPTRRQQLRALLHEFDRHPPPPGAATFDTARLRAALGLPEG